MYREVRDRVNGDAVLNDSRSEGGSAYLQGVIDKLSDRLVIIPEKQQLAEGVIHPAPEKFFKGLIVPAFLEEAILFISLGPFFCHVCRGN